MNNEFENNANDMELEDMRQQMKTLKKKLDEQAIVNDNLIRRSMKKEVSTITRRYYILMVVGILMVPYGYWAFVMLNHFSIAFWIATSIFMLICVGATFYNSHKISDPGLMSHSLIEARKKVASAKKFDADWLKFGIPAAILWLGWFCYESYQRVSDFNPIIFMIAGIVGGTLGAIAGLKIHFKTQRQYQDIINQIEDITKGDS